MKMEGCRINNKIPEYIDGTGVLRSNQEDIETLWDPDNKSRGN